MEEHWTWYLAGFFDSTANFRVKIQKDDRLSMGYSVTPELRIGRPTEVQTVYGLVDEFAEEVGAKVRYYEHNEGNSVRLEVDGPEDIRRLIEPMLPGFVQQYERAEFFLSDVLPEFKDGPPQTKESFVEVMEVVDEFNEYPARRGSSKYDADYFRNEWELE